MGIIYSINISTKKGIAKKRVNNAILKEDFGIVGDIHSGLGDRQVSLLSLESIQSQAKILREKDSQCPKSNNRTFDTSVTHNGSLSMTSTELSRMPNPEHVERVDLKPGDFAENITTEGLGLSTLKIGDILKINEDITLRVSRIGKDCHRYCGIYYKIGSCIMPKEGIFCAVVKGGNIKTGDKIEIF